MKSTKRLLSCNQRGQTLVEFSLIVLLLLAILFGIAEFGRAWYYSNHLTNSVRAAARYGAVLVPFDASQVETYLRDEITAGHMAGNDTSVTLVSVTPANPSRGDTIKVVVSYQFQVLVGSYFLPFFPFNESRPIIREASMQYEGGN